MGEGRKTDEVFTLRTGDCGRGRESQRGDLDLIGQKWLRADFCPLTDFIVRLNFPAGDAWLR